MLDLILFPYLHRKQGPSVKAKKLVSLENYVRSKRQYIHVEASKSISKCISIYCASWWANAATNLGKKNLGGLRKKKTAAVAKHNHKSALRPMLHAVAPAAFVHTLDVRSDAGVPSSKWIDPLTLLVQGTSDSQPKQCRKIDRSTTMTTDFSMVWSS